MESCSTRGYTCFFSGTERRATSLLHTSLSLFCHVVSFPSGEAFNCAFSPEYFLAADRGDIYIIKGDKI